MTARAAVRRLEDLPTVVGVLLDVVRVGVVLRRGGFARVLQRFDLRPEPSSGLPPQVPPGTGRAVRVAVGTTRLLGDRATCLHKALALQQTLLRLDVPATVVVGVDGAGGFSAHAWVDTPRGRLDPNRRDLAPFVEAGRFTAARWA